MRIFLFLSLLLASTSLLWGQSSNSSIIPDRIYPVSPHDIMAATPTEHVEYRGEKWWFDARGVVVYNEKDARWYRPLMVDFPIGNMVNYYDHLIITDKTLEFFYVVNPVKKELAPFEFPQRMFFNPDDPVVGIDFITGYSNCHNNRERRRSYHRVDGAFVYVPNPEQENPLPKMAAELSVLDVKALLMALDDSRFTELGYTDLALSPEDIPGYKRFIKLKIEEIREERDQKLARGFNSTRKTPSIPHKFDPTPFEIPLLSPRKYIFPLGDHDLSPYWTYADSLITLPNKTLNQVFNQHLKFGTVNPYWRVEFRYESGIVLAIYNYDSQPNYLSTPYDITFNGLKFSTNSFEVGRQLSQVSNGQLFGGLLTDKNYAIYNVIHYLYRTQVRYGI